MEYGIQILKIFILVTIFPLFSCAQNDGNSNNLKETEINGYIEPNLYMYQKPDTIIVNWENLSDKDTLIIGGYIEDCGEFGGHNEYIKIYKCGKNLTALFKMEHIQTCRGSVIGKDRTLKNKTVLSDSGIALINRYIKEFGNSFVYYYAAVYTSTFWIVYKGIDYYRKVPSNQLSGFTELRDRLFRKNRYLLNLPSYIVVLRSILH